MDTKSTVIWLLFATVLISARFGNMETKFHNYHKSHNLSDGKN